MQTNLQEVNSCHQTVSVRLMKACVISCRKWFTQGLIILSAILRILYVSSGINFKKATCLNKCDCSFPMWLSIYKKYIGKTNVLLNVYVCEFVNYFLITKCHVYWKFSKQNPLCTIFKTVLNCNALHTVLYTNSIVCEPVLFLYFV